MSIVHCLKQNFDCNTAIRDQHGKTSVIQYVPSMYPHPQVLLHRREKETGTQSAHVPNIKQHDLVHGQPVCTRLFFSTYVKDPGDEATQCDA